MTIRVTGLFWYPVKSCRGYAIAEAQVDRRGVRDDRSFMITDPHGVFLTQRELPRLALITPVLADDALTLSAPGMEPLATPIRRAGPTREVIVWQSVCRAVDQGDAAAEWLGAALDAPARLVRLADDHVRPVDPQYAAQSTDQVAFQDGYPFLVISEESLADLNRRMPEPLPMNRFRPTIVVAGAEPYAEDT
ncbi:MAG: MOSC N-terminal beta barrel domain-containing protein, partial [Dehalococcoidia bacterium]|nr:MOSC N-terminal beta barrel domain-containing protein [Dehalococcoidia bacterium]